MPALTDVVYNDLDLNLTTHPVTNQLVTRSNIEAVRQAVKILVLTNLGERPFHPDIGSDVRRSLFENLGPMAASIIQANVTRVIEAYEPRISNLDVQVIVKEDYNGYGVKITFRVVNLATPVVVDLFLERLR